MFTNIGKKIQLLAKIVCWVGIVVSILVGLVFIFYYTNAQSIAVGILTIIFGSLASWLGCFMTMGFGKMVEASEKFLTDSKASSN